ncbi:MAG: penicillin-binding protein 2 [Candidatus Pacebacteria bacterium]|nr:penicillin-binding protein 2 [Candidatus Paceibacterota bacterium]
MNNLRINTLLLFLILLCGLLLARLYYLQIDKGDRYKAMARGQQSIVKEVKGKRGDIYFRDGINVLALTKENPYLFLSPEEIEDVFENEIADKLSQIVNIDKEEIFEKSKVEGSYYQIIKKNLTDEEYAQIEELDYEGINIGKETKRCYPGKEFACQVSGFINSEGEGQYGIEGYYNNILSGKEKIVKKTTNPWGFLSSSEEEINNGADIYLTIDYNIQFKAEKILDKAIKDYGAKSGTIIVADPYSGEILALAQSPRFDLNNYNSVENYLIYQNNATQLLFEPGSIFKSITMAAGLNEGKVDSETIFDDKYGCKQYIDYRVCNYKERSYGKVTMAQILENSINTGVIFVEEALGHKTFLDYVDKFGLMEDLKIGFPSMYSTNKNIKDALKYSIDVTFGNISFGQGIMLTPMHMVKAYLAIANGGDLVTPHIVKKIVNVNDEKDFEKEIEKEDIISLKTSTELTKMLVSVIEGAYSKRAKIEGYYIAGKSGTSQIPYSSLGINKAGYSTETWQTFIGYAPAYNPKFVALVKLDSPTNTTTSEYSAAPTFKELSKYILDYYKIPFDYSLEENTSEKY